jgi:cobalt/nickel transport system permease protein
VTLAHAAEQPAAVETALHRLAPECKVLALVVFVVAVALVPHGAVWPYAIDAALLAAAAVWARAPLRLLAGRLLVEVPFVLFVIVLPFVAHGPQVDVLGVGLSEDGLWTAWGIVAKATLAVLATGVLSATTPAPAILAGAERLHLPRQFTAIAAFAIRYLQVVIDELRRLQLARVARGDDPRWLWQARTVAQSAGALAVRCFARGERVHTAMLARGFDGRLPDVNLAEPARRLAWAAALGAPAVAVAVTLAARGWPA